MYEVFVKPNYCNSMVSNKIPVTQILWYLGETFVVYKHRQQRPSDYVTKSKINRCTLNLHTLSRIHILENGIPMYKLSPEDPVI